MSELIQIGRYPARATGAASVYENQNGTLVLAMEFMVEGQALRHFFSLTTKDGALNERTIGNLKTMFHWDGSDPFWFMEHPEGFSEAEVEVDIEHKQGTNTDRVFANIKYVDPIGGSRGDLPQAANKAKVLAKYGAKFRAVSGGTTAKPAAPKPPAQKAPPPPPPHPVAAPSGKVSDQATCWNRFYELGGKENDWFEQLKKAMPGKNQGDFTPEDWGKVMDYIETNHIPY